jgi:hypothetical protein
LRAAFFAWLAALGKIFTMENLMKRHVIVVDRCYMCKRDRESVDHFLLYREVVGLSWVLPKQIVDLLASWMGSFGSTQSAVVWKMVPSCFLWCLWGERNYRSFEDHKRAMVALKSFFFNTLYL